MSLRRVGYQPRTNFVKVENGDLLADSCNVLNRWKNSFSQKLNIYRINDVRQMKIHTVELLIPALSHFDDEINIARLKRYKSECIDQILTELIEAGSEMLLSEIHKLITSILNQEEFCGQWKECVILPVYKKIG
jgi:hypothetical protein